MMAHTIHILLIEDDPSHAELIQRAFEDRGDESKLTIAHTLAEAAMPEQIQTHIDHRRLAPAGRGQQ